MFTKRHLLKELKRAGLPFTYATLLEYERKGIISKPSTLIKSKNGKWRLYTQEEITENILLIKDYRKNLTDSKKT